MCAPGAGPVLTARYVVYAMGYEMPTAVRPTGYTVHSTYAMATQPQPAEAVAGALPYLGSGGPVSVRPDDAGRAGASAAARTRPFRMRPNGTPCSRPKPPDLSTNSAGYCPSWIVTRPLPGAARSAPAPPACRPSAPFLTGPAALRSWRSAAMALRIAASPPRSLTAQLTGRPDVDADLFAFT